MFRSAYGLYWHDRYKPLAECAVNLFASIVLVSRFGIAGILAGTVISTMTTCFWIEPVLLFKYAFRTSPGRFFRDYIINTAVTLLALGVVWTVCTMLPAAGLPAFLLKMVLCAVLGNVGFLAACCRRKESRYFVRFILEHFTLYRMGKRETGE